MQSNIQERLKRLYSKTRPLVWLKGRLPSVFRGLHDGIRTGSKYEVLHKQDETAEILQQTALFVRSGLRLCYPSSRLRYLVTLLVIILVATGLGARALAHFSSQKKAWKARP